MDRPTTDTPPPPPEAAIIKVAREARGLSPEQASAMAPIRLGPARWRQIEAGYERKDPYKPTTAPDRTLAHMARIVGVTPEQLEAANRAEAANVLREILRQESSPAGSPLQVLEGGGERYDRPAEPKPITLEEFKRMIDQGRDPETPPGGFWNDDERRLWRPGSFHGWWGLWEAISFMRGRQAEADQAVDEALKQRDSRAGSGRARPNRPWRDDPQREA